MIGKTSRGDNFFALASYLKAGLKGDRPERVEWVAARNLATDDLDIAPHVMKATADLSARVRKPCYHLSVSWAHEDQVDQAAMTAVADQLLADLGLDDHQAVMVAHNDTDHQHLHMMINRVHPDHGKAWRGAYDYRAIETSLRAQEEANGYRFVPGRHSGLDREVQRAERAELVLAEREGRAPLFRWSKEKARRWRDRLEKLFLRVSSWGELEDKLSDRGLTLDSKGAGLIVSDNYGYAKLSDLTPHKRRVKDLLAKLGSYADHRKAKERKAAVKQQALNEDRRAKVDRLAKRTREMRRDPGQERER